MLGATVGGGGPILVLFSPLKISESISKNATYIGEAFKMTSNDSPRVTTMITQTDRSTHRGAGPSDIHGRGEYILRSTVRFDL